MPQSVKVASPVPRVGGSLLALLGNAGSAQVLALAERAYRGNPVEYVSPFPRWLRSLRIAAVVALTVWAALCATTLTTMRLTIHTVGFDAAPSIIAAERVRSLLADANGQLANALLSRYAEDGPFLSAMRQDLREAETALAEAARNVTYGSEELGPITTMMRAIPEYTLLVGRARAFAKTGDASAIQDALSADRLMQFTLLPAVSALERVNHEHLSEVYSGRQVMLWALIVASVLAGILACAVLAVLWKLVARRTRRKVEPFVVAGMVAVAAATLVTGYCLIVAQSQLRVAKVDAFDSISALSSAQAYANNANAAESFWLLAHGDVARQPLYAEAFVGRAARLAPLDPDAIVTALNARERFKGRLGDELANITFTGESTAAKQATNEWAQYLVIDQKIRKLETAGRTAEAIALCVGNNAGESNWAFQRFERSLAEVLRINREAFDEAIDRARSSSFLGLAAVFGLAWLVALAGVLIAVERRLRAYAF